MFKEEKILALIKETVYRFLPNAVVMLFGSRARKDAEIDSDYDILVITATDLSVNEKIPIRTSIRKKLLSLGIRSDVLIQSRNEITIKNKLPGHIIKSVLKDAVEL